MSSSPPVMLFASRASLPNAPLSPRPQARRSDKNVPPSSPVAPCSVTVRRVSLRSFASCRTYAGSAALTDKARRRPSLFPTVSAQRGKLRAHVLECFLQTCHVVLQVSPATDAPEDRAVRLRTTGSIEPIAKIQWTEGRDPLYGRSRAKPDATSVGIAAGCSSDVRRDASGRSFQSE